MSAQGGTPGDAGARSRPAGAASAARVRPATPEDVAVIWELLQGLARYERLEAYVTGSSERLAAHLFGDGWPRIGGLVAEQGGRLRGYALYYGVFSSFATGPMLWLEDLYVEEAARGSSLGRALLAAVARVAVERHCSRLSWEVLDWNQPTIGFYERLGATRHGGWFNYRLAGESLKRLAAEA